LNLIDLAREKKCGWIRVDASSQMHLNLLKKIDKLKIKKAPHDMQPKQIFSINIDENEDEILSEMKPKTRYNIRLAEKKGVEIDSVDRESDKMDQYLSDFLRLTEVMAKRSEINPHPREYYQKMVANISVEKLRLYVAKFEGKVIAGALIVFFGDTATYLHGGSDDEFRNVMAPHLLHWQAILNAKEKGCRKYDFGGIKAEINENGKIVPLESKWKGVTRFKLGFSKNAKPLKFLGSYDIVIRSYRYDLYRILQKIKQIFVI
jgi:lipid II:glycine glycyltransferase (peptidoglycan interpeptide bridge formation enzyme)